MVNLNAMRKYHKILSITLASLLLAASFPVNGGTSLAKSAPETLADLAQSNLSSPLPFPFNGALSASAFPTMAAAAGSDFLVLITTANGGEAFGDEQGNVPGRFRGLFAEYDFDLPNVDPRQTHFVMLQSFSVDNPCNRFEINGLQIPVLRDHGGLRLWTTELMRIPINTLKPTDNKLRITSLNENCATGGNENDFAVSNVVIQYRTL
jgi:hypothetical protein